MRIVESQAGTAGKSISSYRSCRPLTSESQHRVLALVNTPIRDRFSGVVYEFEAAGANYLFRVWLFKSANHARAKNTANKPGD